ncbi:MAG TPA: GxxExxY protein [Polyangiaceae bacterium]|nr:GxxExxY protein [Polyangiaceae bacterium]
MNRQDVKTAKVSRTEPRTDLDGIAYRVIGAALEVHRILGPGFLESIYEEALCIELTRLGMEFTRQVPISVRYRDQKVGEARLDLLVGNLLVVELKAVECLAPIHVAQIMSYLKATGLRLGLLITFNVPVLRKGIRRVICSP